MIAPVKLLYIASHNGGSKTLDYIKENWATLSRFTNNTGERITMQQLGKIGNRKSATKGLEVLLKNNHIKTLPMYDLVHILTNDTRTNKFVKIHPDAE
ncbi:MAG: hypothetical protein ACJAUP_001238 [Cellvibrionaceae bacterium]|jgi:hypothetical protein